MSDVKDLTSQMAKELALGIRDNVEDIAAAFRKMAVINPERKKNIRSCAAERDCGRRTKKHPQPRRFLRRAHGTGASASGTL